MVTEQRERTNHDDLQKVRGPGPGGTQILRTVRKNTLRPLLHMHPMHSQVRLPHRLPLRMRITVLTGHLQALLRLRIPLQLRNSMHRNLSRIMTIFTTAFLMRFETGFPLMLRSMGVSTVSLRFRLEVPLGMQKLPTFVSDMTEPTTLRLEKQPERKR